MNFNLTFVLNKFLRKNGYRISEEQLFIELNSHPDLSSIKSITDTLEAFGITSLAVSIPKESYKQIEQPILSRISIGHQSQIALVILNKSGDVQLTQGEGKEDILSIPEFLNIWDGNIVAIEANTKKSKPSISKKIILLSLLIGGMALPMLAHDFLLLHFLFSLFTIFGLLLSYLIYDISSNEQLAKSKFCTLGKNTDCQSVINSESSKILGRLSLLDLTIIYFSGLYLSQILNTQILMLGTISMLSLSAILYSIYQQGIVLKKWCPLCLGVSLILVAQFLIINQRLVLSFEIIEFSKVAFSFAFVSIGWFLIKPLFLSRKELITKSQELRAFKRNYHLFLPYYETLPIIDTNIAAPDIILGGSENAPVKLLAITNPLCKSCFEAHEMYLRLLKKYPNQIQVKLRFYVPVENQNDSRTLVAMGMIKAFLELDQTDFDHALKNWYTDKKVKPWLKSIGMQTTDTKFINLLIEQKNWCLENGIDITPTMLINKKRFPSFYTTMDLENFIEELMEYLEQNKNLNTEELKLQHV